MLLPAIGHISVRLLAIMNSKSANLQVLLILHGAEWPQNIVTGFLKPVKIIGLKIVSLQANVSQLKSSGDKLRIMISGDGARMTRRTSFVVMSFSLLDSDDVMSSKGRY